MANKKTSTQRSVAEAVTQMPFEKAVEEIAKMPITKAAYEMGKLAGQNRRVAKACATELTAGMRT